MKVMAFDIYSGSLARYYLGVWENEAARYARENNLSYNIIRPHDGNSSEDRLSQEEMMEIICNWIHSLSSSFEINFDIRESFQEVYFSKRFHNFNLLYTANCYLNTADESLSDLGSLLDEKEAKKIQKTAEKKSDFIYFRDVEAWFPIALPGSGIYQIEFPTQQEKMISSTDVLLEELNHLSYGVFKLPIEELKLTTETTEDFLILRQDMISMYEAVIFSVKNKVPILLDY